MRPDVYIYIKNNKDLLRYLRDEPSWYRRLSRNPFDLKEFERSALKHYKKTIPDQVEKVSQGLQLASAMLAMFQSMNSQ